MKKLWTSPLVSFFREAILLYFSRRVPQAAACLAYFVILAVFPVLICVSYILGLVNIDVGSLIGQLQTILPQAALDVLESYLRYIAIHRSPGLFWQGWRAVGSRPLRPFGPSHGSFWICMMTCLSPWCGAWWSASCSPLACC